MNFVTLGYLLFLVVVVAGFWLLPGRARLWWLLGASLVFYGSWNAVYIPGFLALIVFNHVMALAARGPRGRLVVTVAVAVDVGLLVVFKYLDWLLGSTASLVEVVTGRQVDLGLMGLLLPLGISFVTLTLIAYVVDTHRGRPPERDLLRFGVFALFFPRLIAGPIVRGDEFLPQLRRWRPFHRRLLGEGGPQLVTGMLKKSVADQLSPVVAAALDAPETYSSVGLAVALVAYTFQLYLDFSGYTDIALGSARLMGLRLPRNFDWPYRSTNMAEFWTRWHMTLGRWLRDYLYFPMGGSRRGNARAYAALMATMVLCGLWHGAGLGFLVWGALQGVALCAYRFWRRLPGAPRLPVWAAWLVTFAFVVLVRTFFIAEDVPQAIGYLREMLSFQRGELPPVWVMIGVGVGILAQWTRVEEVFRRVVLGHPDRRLLAYGVSIMLVVLLLPTTTPDFIYFRF